MLCAGSLCDCLLSVSLPCGWSTNPSARLACMQAAAGVCVEEDSNLVDPASSHMLVSKIKPCMSKYKLLYGETANGSLKQL